ncbi:hypothetical protein CCUS01_08967 [Colletotrichum cuscutae]|uniref:Uncharacterized protein n=1 Tax=Colletotrichum cuscutae TaxID=1209917 RepID=A0AAI9ULA6_9PEZI|nr:hypothetical protein CCUS01_08967 [Colletotrichum cuscutae]
MYNIKTPWNAPKDHRGIPRVQLPALLSCHLFPTSQTVVTREHSFPHTAVNPPFPPAQQTTQPLDAQPRPLLSLPREFFCRGSGKGAGCGVDDFHHGGVEAGVRIELGERKRRGRAGLEPVTAKVEKAAVGPVARGEEEDQQQKAAVDAGPVEEIGADEEEEDEGRRGVGWDEEEGEPAVRELSAEITTIGRGIASRCSPP